MAAWSWSDAGRILFHFFKIIAKYWHFDNCNTISLIRQWLLARNFFVTPFCQRTRYRQDRRTIEVQMLEWTKRFRECKWDKITRIEFQILLSASSWTLCFKSTPSMSSLMTFSASGRPSCSLLFFSFFSIVPKNPVSELPWLKFL